MWDLDQIFLITQPYPNNISCWFMAICPLWEESRDLTAFHAYDYGLTSLPQGYTNSMSEFCRRTSHMLEPVKDDSKPYVDDCMGKGPKMRYNEEPILGNPLIRRFIYEGFQVLERVCMCMIAAGVTISGEKVILATPILEITAWRWAYISHVYWLDMVISWQVFHLYLTIVYFIGYSKKFYSIPHHWIENHRILTQASEYSTK